MNTQNPIGDVMTKDLITICPTESLKKVDEIFRNNKIHHIPIVEYKKLVGILSKSDFQFFQRGNGNGKIEDKVSKQVRYTKTQVKDLMTTGIARISSKDKIAVAIELFKENLFHCIPIVDDEELVGLVTPLDIIKSI